MRPNSFSIIKRPARIRISRRDLLRGFGALGVLSRLPVEARAQTGGFTPAPGTRASARTCIFINLLGAPSQVDTFDYKAGAAPGNHNIVTSNGITLNKTIFPNLSLATGDLCLLRSMQSVEEAHPRGQWAVHTAHSSNPVFDAETPHIGSVVASELPAGKFPAFLSLNGSSGQGAAFLGGAYGPTTTSSCGFPFFQHDFYGPSSQQRFIQKFELLKSIDPSRSSSPDPAFSDFDAFYDTARGMMYDPAIGNVFACADADVTRYGNTEIGKALLVARRAVQARNGARFIHVTHQNWDTHSQLYSRGYRLAGVLANVFDLALELDRALAALIGDLKASGDLASTLIVVMGEFGRTPGPLNGQGGRDHLKTAMCGLMAGGGVAGGRVIGATDSLGRTVANPGWSQNRGIYIQDVVATIYSALGIDWTKSIPTPSGRLFQYCPTIATAVGDTPAPVNEVFA